MVSGISGCESAKVLVKANNEHDKSINRQTEGELCRSQECFHARRKTVSRSAKAMPVDLARNYVVSGVATYVDSTPAPGMFVRAYDRDRVGEDTLGKATTEGAGKFSIRYGDADFARTKNERGGADVVVRVYDGKQELLFTSKKKNNAPD
jgi:hypothetical protein